MSWFCYSISAIKLPKSHTINAQPMHEALYSREPALRKDILDYRMHSAVLNFGHYNPILGDKFHLFLPVPLMTESADLNITISLVCCSLK